MARGKENRHSAPLESTRTVDRPVLQPLITNAQPGPSGSDTPDAMVLDVAVQAPVPPVQNVPVQAPPASLSVPVGNPGIRPARLVEDMDEDSETVDPALKRPRHDVEAMILKAAVADQFKSLVFYGKKGDSLEEWFHILATFMASAGIARPLWAKYAFHNLRGEATRCFLATGKSPEELSWEQFIQAMKGTPLCQPKSFTEILAEVVRSKPKANQPPTEYLDFVVTKLRTLIDWPELAMTQLAIALTHGALPPATARAINASGQSLDSMKLQDYKTLVFRTVTADAQPDRGGPSRTYSDVARYRSNTYYRQQEQKPAGPPAQSQNTGSQASGSQHPAPTAKPAGGFQPARQPYKGKGKGPFLPR